MHDYGLKVLEIVAHAEQYHEAFYAAQTFHGPSLYFHRRALEHDEDFTRRLERIYATLAAWGMHRMGKGGSKMLPFEDFQSSVMPLKDLISEATGIKVGEIGDGHWEKIKYLFCHIKVMKSGTSIVGNSKVMAHLLPNIVPPIDREHTLRLLIGNTNIVNNLDREWQLMREVISRFFIPVSVNPEFQVTAKKWIADQTSFPWDTSVPKIIDNLIIGARKLSLAVKSGNGGPVI
jgi:hypothetical protein